MKKLSDRNGNDGCMSGNKAVRRIYNIGNHLPTGPVDSINEDLKLKGLLKRAVQITQVPQSLIDSIKNGIRK